MKSTERGEGKLSALLWLLFFAAVVYGGFKVAPVYIDNYSLTDKMNEIARSPRGTTPDEKIMDMLMKYVREQHLDAYVARSQFEITTLETSRRIRLNYRRTTEVLPGWKHTFTFRNQVDQPLIY
jgi:hypothetical protein